MGASEEVWRRVRSLDHLYSLSKAGKTVRTDSVTYYSDPRNASTVIGSDVRTLGAAIEKGMFYLTKGKEENDPAEGGILLRAQAAIRSTGLSHAEVAEKRGVSAKAVNKFLGATSANTKTVDSYLEALGLTI